jgi:osmotically inducible protein OsmC
LKLELSIPKELGGPGKPGATNPEQLFAAGYAACFESAIRHAARSQRVLIKDLQVEAQVGLGAVSTGFALQVSLHSVFDGLEQSLCEELVMLAHQICPYSNAIRNNIEVQLMVN